jgi:hypothetical protein
VDELNRNFPPVLLNSLRQPPESRDKAIFVDSHFTGESLPLLVDVGSFCDNQARPAPGPARKVLDQPFGDFSGPGAEVGNHRGHDDPVPQNNAPDPSFGKKPGIGNRLHKASIRVWNFSECIQGPKNQFVILVRPQ